MPITTKDLGVATGIILFCATSAGVSADTTVSKPQNNGPYNVRVLAGGIGAERPLAPDSPISRKGSAWTLSGWIRDDDVDSGRVVIAAIGELSDKKTGSGWRGLVLDGGELEFWLSAQQRVRSRMTLQAHQWYAVAATYDGRVVRLFIDGKESGSLAANTLSVEPLLAIAPVLYEGADRAVRHFGGALAQFLIEDAALDATQAASRATSEPDFDLLTVETLGAGWPWQEHAWRGLQTPQDPWTLPASRAAIAKPSIAPFVESPPLAALNANTWTLGGWRLQAAPQVAAEGDQISRASFDSADWYEAIVPGTVLTTLIARGVYPDSDFGLNNRAIPESLNRQDYWYRTTFIAPPRLDTQQFTLTFKGVNYSATVWVNGREVGGMRGAFIRGVFDVTHELLPGQRNAVAVRVSPAPHPGIPHEQSIIAGPGNNGGAMAIDGPTFFASEGWDWIPAIRDRNTGLWQPVELSRAGALTILDPHVVTHLPLPRTDEADISISIPVLNARKTSRMVSVRARFDNVVVRQVVSVAPGTTNVVFTPEHFSALRIKDPRLWWPNGYGEPLLHAMRIDLLEAGVVSDTTSLRFGMRQLTYDLSLFDRVGRLRRVQIDPTLATLSHERLVNVRHEAINQTPNGWAESLTLAGEKSSAVRPSDTTSLSPYLVIRVNGIAIAARGGNWGMDDSRKRISREHLEPYFKLTRDAHLNIIRNWVGQNTEDVFYDLADEYGLLVLNDFWASTQDFQMEPQDPELFLANARDVVSRYRNHPSIAVWFGRNEGVPQPIINEGLDDLIASLDGTRYYTGSSNSINLQGSGPYNYRPPEGYFTTLASGFSVEVGTPSLSTLESLRASIPVADEWPLGDAYAYHDWHFGGNGDVATFMAELSAEFGEATGLEDFERKAQMLDYVSYRAIFEGFQAHLWTKNSGRLLWMTQPAWPSNTWQIYSSDYDTAAAYFGVMKACEPVHAQLNLPDFTLAVSNITPWAQRNLQLRTRIVTADNHLLDEQVDRIDADANAVTTLPRALKLKALLEHEDLVLVQLTLTDSTGHTLSTNTYWQGLSSSSMRRLNELKPQSLTVDAGATPTETGQRVTVDLRNDGTEPVLNVKLTALNALHNRVLPAYYSDNYVTLLPAERRRITIDCPVKSGACVELAVRGWNVTPRTRAITVTSSGS